MNAIAQAQAELMITVLSGPDKGATYKLVSAKITLGRATDNSIIIKDARASRHHAFIELTPNGIFVTDISSQNSLSVDGTLTKHAILKSGSQITIGSTLLRFEVKSQLPQVPTVRSQALDTYGKQTSPMPLSPPTFSKESRNSNDQNKKRNFYIVVGLVVLGFILLLAGPKIKKSEEIPIRNEEMIEEEIKASQERKTAIEKQQSEKGIGTVEYNETQSAYLQGFRDYREGNYARALSSFSAVLALNPKHELAYKYRELAKRRNDELIELTMLQGKRYMEQNKYALAKNSYQQVMILIGDPKNKLYLEAREYWNECALLMKGAY